MYFLNSSRRWTENQHTTFKTAISTISDYAKEISVCFADIMTGARD